MRTIHAVAITCCVAGTFACNGNDRATRTSDDIAKGGAPSSQANAPADQSNAPVTLVGCLQKGDGLRTTYMLTRANEPSTSVGTSGETRPGAVEKEQRRFAASTYVLNPKGDVKLDDLVGKEVRVTGTIARTADLPAATAGNSSDTTQRPDIDKDNPAKVDVTSATMTSDTCGREIDVSQGRGRRSSDR